MTRSAEQVDPWARWGWLMGAVWLFFFVFPLYDVWNSSVGLTTQLATTAIIVGFSAVYIATLRVTTARVTCGDYPGAARLGYVGLGALVLLAVALALLIRANSMTTMPFIVSLPVFFLPWRESWIASSTLLVAGVVGSFVAWGWMGSLLWGISVLVLAISVVSRYLEERTEEQRETASQLQVTEERERVARDVHDVLGHSLTVVTLKTELAQRLVDVDPERAKQEMAEVQDLARQALAEIRATVGGLRVARLSDEVEGARRALRDAGVEAELPSDLSIVDPRHRITIAWVLREAVTNVVRHAQARRVQVEVDSDRLTVTDDGRGLRGRAEGNGISGLRERVAQAGGTLTIGEGPEGRGTRLEVRL